MAEKATTEFWKDIKPIPESFRPGAQHVGRRADGLGGRAGEPALPPAAGVGVHDQRQVGLSGAQLDEQGGTVGHLDVFDYLKLCREHYAQVGIGPEYLASIIR